MIRIKALAVIARPTDGALLVTEHDDEVTGRFARPLGVSVEFGELALDAIHREFQEELGCGLLSVSLLAVLENIFTLSGEPGHEINFVYRAELADASLYERESIPIRDVPGLHTHWWSPTTHHTRLVPVALADLLAI